jgi:hypothetical protein
MEDNQMTAKKNTKPKVKMLVCYHKPAHLLKDDVFVPMHLGRAVATQASKDGTVNSDDLRWMMDNMIGDDTGKNISVLNRRFIETTASYWAWKYYAKLGNPDYIGLCHYRRLFIANEKYHALNNTACWHAGRAPAFGAINDFFEDMTKYKDIDKIAARYDLIMPRETLISTINKNAIVPEDVYSDITHRPLDCEHVYNFIRKNFPGYADVAREYMFEYQLWIPFNMFVMKKKMFFEYAKFLFAVINDYAKFVSTRTDAPFIPTDDKHMETRLPALMSEIVTAIFIRQQQKNPKLKIKKLFVSFLDNPSVNSNSNANAMIWKIRKYRLLQFLTFGAVKSFIQRKNYYVSKLV